jgi:hypothetical protein
MDPVVHDSGPKNCMQRATAPSTISAPKLRLSSDLIEPLRKGFGIFLAKKFHYLPCNRSFTRCCRIVSLKMGGDQATRAQNREGGRIKAACDRRSIIDEYPLRTLT